MFCIVAAVVLSVLGIFSASNRQLAREAFDCVFRRVTFRPCNTGFDEKMKAKLLGFAITRSEKGARWLNRYFEPLAWVFFILMLVSSIYTVRGLYLYYTTGSCNGLNNTGFCVFDPSGKNNEVSAVAEACRYSDVTGEGPSLDGMDLTLFPVYNAGADKQVVFIGCYACEYTRKAYPQIMRLVNKTDARLVFLEYPTKTKSDYLARVGACVYQAEPDKLWDLNEALYAQEVADLESETATAEVLTGLGLDAAQINACANNPETVEAVGAQLKAIENTGFQGTPTVFINGESAVGPKPYRVYAIMLEGLFYWLK